MKKRILIALVVVLALAATASLVWAGGPVDKATGEIWFVSPVPEWGVAYARFNAHEPSDGRPTKGQYYYSDDTGYYLLDLDQVEVTGQEASFWGNIVKSNRTDRPVGMRVNIKVLDGGTPGTDGDLITGQAGGGEAGDPWIPMIFGNLVVHNY